MDWFKYSIPTIVMILFIVWGLLRQRRKGMWIDPDDPLNVKARAMAVSTFKEATELAVRESLPIRVKYPFKTDTDQTERIWGYVMSFDEAEIVADIETNPISQFGWIPDSVTFPVADLDDWTIELPDGKIRGCFGVQAEIILREREGGKVPKHIREMQSEFVDKLTFDDDTDIKNDKE